MPDTAWRGVANQDSQHLPQHFRCKIPFLEPHAVLMPVKSPHRTGVALERSDAAMEELLHHLGRCHAKHPQPLKAAPDKSEVGAHELLVTPSLDWG